MRDPFSGALWGICWFKHNTIFERNHCHRTRILSLSVRLPYIHTQVDHSDTANAGRVNYIMCKNDISLLTDRINDLCRDEKRVRANAARALIGLKKVTESRVLGTGGGGIGKGARGRDVFGLGGDSESLPWLRWAGQGGWVGPISFPLLAQKWPRFATVRSLKDKVSAVTKGALE